MNVADNYILLVPSFEIQADIFTCLNVSDKPSRQGVQVST